jgi:hypothetical protein
VVFLNFAIRDSHFAFLVDLTHHGSDI